MSWSSGTYTKGNNASGGWAGDAAANIGIEAGRHDTQDNDFAAGINNCLTKDGQNTPTANLPMGGYKHTGVANASNATDYMAYGQIRDGLPLYMDKTNNKVGIGTTSPIYTLDVQGGGATPVGSVYATFSNFSADAQGPSLQFQKSRGTTVGSNTIVQAGDTLGAIRFWGNNGQSTNSYNEGARIIAFVDGTPGATNDMPTGMIFSTTADGNGTVSDRMRITNDGRVGINTSSVSGILHVYNPTSTIAQLLVQGLTTSSGGSGKASIDLDVNGNGGWQIENNASGGSRTLTISDNNGFGSGTVERLRIDNAGLVGIGVTPVDRLHIFSGDDNALRLDTNNNRPLLRFVRSGTSRATVWTDGGAFITGSADALACRAGASGGVYLAQTGTSWTAISDERFKKNVENLNYGLKEILALRPIRFDYVDDESDSSARLGFIAQEVKPLIPEIVVGDETIKLGVSITDLIPTLVKAIQELNAKVESLEARVAELEK